MSKRALVTGAAGFVGQHLTQRLVREGWAVTGASAAPARGGVLSPQEAAAVDWRIVDLRESARIGPLLDASRPDAIVHLAGIAHVMTAQRDPAMAQAVNVGICGRLVAEVAPRRNAGEIDPVLLVIGSAEQYGRHEPSAMPLGEDAARRPMTVYAETKAAQEALALEAHREAGLRVLCTRSFNHSGPGQDPDFLIPSVVRRVLALKATGGRTLLLGNTTPVRDYLHVRDVADAYVALIERGAPGTVYNVASGVGRDVAEIAAVICRVAGLDGDIVIDPSLVREMDVPALVGDASRLRATTGWAPTRSFDDLIADVIADVMHAAT